MALETANMMMVFFHLKASFDELTKTDSLPFSYPPLIERSHRKEGSSSLARETPSAFISTESNALILCHCIVKLLKTHIYVFKKLYGWFIVDAFGLKII